MKRLLMIQILLRLGELMLAHELLLLSISLTKKQYVSLFKIECLMNLTIDFVMVPPKIKGNFTYSTTENCFPKSFSVILDNPSTEFSN